MPRFFEALTDKYDIALYQLPVLHEPTFIQDVADVYSGSIDPYKNFQLKMVLAISMQRLSRQYATIADSYFLAGLEHLEEVLESMDHRTLQCLLVMAQYALVTPTRMAVSVNHLLNMVRVWYLIIVYRCTI